MTDLEEALRMHMTACAEALYPTVRTHTEERAFQRVQLVARCSPNLLCMFAEPWKDLLHVDARMREIFNLCGKLHLYARVLDDAVDENLPCHRRALLMAQPFFVETVYRLGKLAMSAAQDVSGLIQETIDAVLADDDEVSVNNWERKNHHLLLIPLLLASDQIVFTEAKAALSTSICVLQASDELAQASHLRLASYTDLVTSIETNQVPLYLATHGWKTLALRVCRECRAILEQFEVS